MRLLPRFSVVTLLLAVLFAPTAPAADLPKDWAYKRADRPAVPTIRNPKHEIRNEIDRFVIAKVSDRGLSLAPEADRRMLIRRVYFDLIGLPPSPEEVEAFVNDKADDVYEKIVDRLLASPQFGERMANWWLDVARFAETDGFKADDVRPNAWRYRDYVIKSFNADKPFDRFVKEQLAGDELFPNDPDAIVATGFLRHFPYEYNAVDVEQKRQDMLNDLTDTTAAAFLGITLGCAKCHDHKTDPITQQDYYQFQAFFAGFWPVEVPLLSVTERAEYERKLATWETEDGRVAKADGSDREADSRQGHGEGTRPVPRRILAPARHPDGEAHPAATATRHARRTAGLHAEQGQLGTDEASRPREVGRDGEADGRVRQGATARATRRDVHDGCGVRVSACEVAATRQLAQPRQGRTRPGFPLGN